jgi:hypothetical protein
MSFKSKIFSVYLATGIVICLWFSVAAAKGWKAPNMGFLDGSSSSSSSGRSYGGSWGGGK